MTLLCPRCTTELTKIRVSELGPSVEVDRCVRCGGVWLDSGELEEIQRQREALVKGENQ